MITSYHTSLLTRIREQGQRIEALVKREIEELFHGRNLS